MVKKDTGKELILAFLKPVRAKSKELHPNLVHYARKTRGFHDCPDEGHLMLVLDWLIYEVEETNG